jgi:hypothetical protein
MNNRANKHNQKKLVAADNLVRLVFLPEPGGSEGNNRKSKGIHAYKVI